MKNPIVSQSISIFKLTNAKRSEEKTIVCTYGKSGTAYAFHGFSDQVIGKAGGGGYDKTSSALLSAIQKLLNTTIDANGAAGFQNVADGVRKLKQGWKLTKTL